MPSATSLVVLVPSAESKSESNPKYWPSKGLLNTNLSPDAA